MTMQNAVPGPLLRIAQDVMRQRGVLPDFSSAAQDQAKRIIEPAHDSDASIRDLA